MLEKFCLVLTKVFRPARTFSMLSFMQDHCCKVLPIVFSAHKDRLCATSYVRTLLPGPSNRISAPVKQNAPRFFWTPPLPNCLILPNVSEGFNCTIQCTVYGKGPFHSNPYPYFISLQVRSQNFSLANVTY